MTHGDTEERLAKDDFSKGEIGYVDSEGSVRRLPVPHKVTASEYRQAVFVVKAWNVGRFRSVPKPGTEVR